LPLCACREVIGAMSQVSKHCSGNDQVPASHFTAEHCIRLIILFFITVQVATIPRENTKKMWANAHETRDSINLISYAGCLGLSPVISAKIHSKCASQPEIPKI